jgi:hypothetical protein
VNLSISAVWDNPEHTIIRVTYLQGWTPEDFVRLLNQIYQMIDSASHEVDLIHEVRHSRRPPARLLSLARHVKEKRHPRQGLHIVVGATLFIRALTEVTSRIIPEAKNVLFVSSLEEARSLITEKRQSRR